MQKKIKNGTWKYIKNKKVREWARNKERDRLAGVEKKIGKSGHVYIFALGQTGLYKIGCTVNVKRRLQVLRAGNPELKCIWSAWSLDMQELERRLHKQFNNHKIEREIFKLSSGELWCANEIANQFR